MAAKDLTNETRGGETHDGDDSRKIHVSRIPTSFDEKAVKRLIEENVGTDTVADVTLIYKRPDQDDEAEEPDTDASKSKKERKKKHKENANNNNNTGDENNEALEHRGFGFVTFTTDESHQKALELQTVRGGRKATSTRKHTLYLRPYCATEKTELDPQTQICYLWSQHRCPYGEECKFLHKGEGGCLIVTPLDEKAKKKKQKCFAFKKGKCKRGDECPYSHDFVRSKPVEAADGSPEPVQDTVTTLDKDKPAKKEKPDSEKDCINWKTKGKCRKGDKCPYRHDEALREAALLKKKRKQGQDSVDDDPQGSNNKKARRDKRQPLWVRLFGLAYDTREHDVRQFLESCGTIMEIQFPRFEDSGRSKGYCGVLFQSPKAVAKALELDGEELMGRWLRIQAGKMLLDQWEDREKNPQQSQYPDEQGEQAEVY